MTVSLQAPLTATQQQQLQDLLDGLKVCANFPTKADLLEALGTAVQNALTELNIPAVNNAIASHIRTEILNPCAGGQSFRVKPTVETQEVILVNNTVFASKPVRPGKNIKRINGAKKGRKR
jgi:hypothetical protein